jgi:hypothetical protein
MSMKIERLVNLGCIVALVASAACSSSSGGASSMQAEEAGPPSSSSGAASSSGMGVGTEQQILCLGNFYCNTGTVCCGNMQTQSAQCSTGPACPLGQLQICLTDADCGGSTCTTFTYMGIPAGTCGLGGLFGGSSGSGSSSSSGSGASSSGGSSSGGSADADAVEDDGASADGSPDASTD